MGQKEMQAARRASMRVMTLAIAGCILLILARLGYASFSMSRDAHHEADERLARQTDILREHAMNVFNSTDVVLSGLLEMTGGLTDAAIRAEFPRWHDRLTRITRRLPHLESIWIIDADGHVCATDAAALPDLDASRRDYFAAQASADAGLFMGTAVTPPLANVPLANVPPSFAVSRRRERPDGSFAGIVAASLRPDEFVAFYRDIASEPDAFLALMRTDATLLMRFPPLPAGARPAPLPLPFETAAGRPDHGILTGVSAVDGRERRIAWRRLDPYPVFVIAGQETAAIRRAWIDTLTPYVMVGLPANLLLLAAVLVAWSRTRALFDEAARRIAAEEALQRVQRMEALGELTGGVAHDFNNLLMIVLGNVERMRRRPREAGDIRALDTIIAAVRRGEALTRQLLTFAGRRALFPEPIDLARQIAGMRDLLIHSLRRDIAVTIDAAAPPGSHVVKVDVGEFELAVLNVAVNARDAMPRGGRLTLRLRRVTLSAEQGIDNLRGEFVALSLTDTGTGMTPEVLARVFDPFFTTKGIGKGTGLGLSQVHGFARQSGGAASIDSTEDAGTTVTFYLPFSHETPAPPPEKAAIAELLPLPPGTGRRALLVEDNPDAATVTRIRLELLGFDVTLAVSAQAALSLLEQQNYAFVIANLMPAAPGISGMELAQALRARPVPVILTADPDVAGPARQEGFIVLNRRSNEPQLREAVAAALSGAKAMIAGG